MTPGGGNRWFQEASLDASTENFIPNENGAAGENRRESAIGVTMDVDERVTFIAGTGVDREDPASEEEFPLKGKKREPLGSVLRILTVVLIVLTAIFAVYIFMGSRKTDQIDYMLPKSVAEAAAVI